MATKRQLRGFTLIELLISITILALVIGIATFSFSLFSRNWDGPKSNFERASGQLQRLDLLSRALSDAIPWLVRDDDGELGFYFLGRDEGLTLVTGSPIYAVGSPAVIRVFRESQGLGRWRLVYEEASLQQVLLRRSSQTLPFNRRLVVVDNLGEIGFSYFGWGSAQQRLLGDEPGSGFAAQWWADYDGLVRVQQPQRIAIKLDGFATVFPLAERTQVLLNRASPEL